MLMCVMKRFYSRCKAMALGFAFPGWQIELGADGAPSGKQAQPQAEEGLGDLLADLDELEVLHHLACISLCPLECSKHALPVA